MIRLDKALTHMGLATRSEVKKLVRKGHIEINGMPAESADMKISEDDEIRIDGVPYFYREHVYLMLNKPEGVISATEGAETTVIDLIDTPVRGLFPVGRLDKDTTGLLLLTDDGDLAHRLLSPKHHVDKEYEVELKLPVSEEDIALIGKGIKDSEDQFLPAEYHPITETKGRIILQEGRYHEVKRIFAALGNEVMSLKRIRMKNLVLDESLAPGEYRELSADELRGLQEDSPAE